MDFALPHPLPGLLAALATGLLIGLERGWAQRAMAAGQRVAGFRTFGLLGFAGGMAALLPDMLAAVLALGAMGVLLIGYRATISEQQLSATTTLAGLLTFGIGLAAVRLSPTIALASAACAFALLSARHSSHALLRGLTEAEIEGVARFALVALVILPLLPDANYGPYEAWNPRQIWMVVVLVTGFSFAGYVVARKFGSGRGVLMMALTGAIVSSTAVTAWYARRLSQEPELRGVLTAGIAIASIVMFVRVLIVAGALAVIAWRREDSADGPPVTLGNPFDFGPALMLAAFVAVFGLAARWALDVYGDGGIMIVLGLTGLMDVDAAVITFAGMPVDALDSATAGFVLAAPVFANTAVKGVLAMVLGGGRNGLLAAAPLFASLLASLAGIAVYQLL